MWKSRTYAFLLRRVLGPFLDEVSLQQLQADVSILEGCCSLSDISLQIDSLNDRIATHLPVAFRSVKIENLSIQLRLQEADTEDGEGSSSTAWKAFQLGSADSKVVLVVHLDLDGVSVELEPNTPTARSANIDEIDDGERAPKSTLAMYMDAALRALELSFQLRNVSIRLVDPSDGNCNKWIVFNLEGLSYETVHIPTRSTSSAYHTTLHKSVEWHNLEVLIGSTQSPEHSLALMEGLNRATLRIVEYQQEDSDGLTFSQNDMEVSLENAFHVVTYLSSIKMLQDVATTIRNRMSTSLSQQKKADASMNLSDNGQILCEQEDDVETLTSIMQQYKEARKLVENNEVRGGILVPSDSIHQDGGETFDVFFDANGSSIYNHADVLRESLMIGRAQSASDDTRIRSKVRFFLRKATVKLLLWTPDEVDKHDEYILFTLHELTVCSSLSRISQTVSCVVGEAELDDSLLLTTSNGIVGQEIGALLRFVAEVDPLVQSPCVDLSVVLDNGDERTVRVDAAIRPVAITFRTYTISKIARLVSLYRVYFPTEVAVTSGSERGVYFDSCLRVSLTCPSVDVEFPLPRKLDLSTLVNRAGYLDYGSRPTPSFGVRIDGLSLQTVDQDVAEASETCRVELHGIFFCVKIPCSESSQYRIFDIMSISGRTEVSPVIPINVRIWQNRSARSEAEGDIIPLNEIFPFSPPVSAFKTRQEDDEGSPAGSGGASCFDSGSTVQDRMAKSLSECEFVTSVNAAQVMCDLDIIELSTILRAAKLAASQCTQDFSIVSSGSESEKSDSDCRVGITAEFESVSVALRGEDKAAKCDLFHLGLSSVKLHLQQGRGEADFLRMSSHHFELLAVRVDSLRKRLTFSMKASLQPLVYRSHVFDPISSMLPNIVVDFFVPSPAFGADISEVYVYANIYDLTFRLDVERTNWLDLIQELADSTAEPKTPEMESDTSSLFRIFSTLSDCNIDYTTPLRYETAARAICRIGNLRLTSNVVIPPTISQALAVRTNDVTLYICNRRFPYDYENTKLKGMFLSGSHPDSTVLIQPASVVRREMNFRSIFTLDSLDTTIVLSNKERHSDDAAKFVRLSVGEMALLACKDSFDLLVEVLSDVASDFSLVDGERFHELEATPIVSRKSSEEDLVSKLNQRRNGVAADEFSEPDETGPLTQPSPNAQYFLDGYDWTTISANTEDKPTVPEGEDQHSQWFVTPTSDLSDVLEERDQQESPAKRSNARPKMFVNHIRSYASAQSLETGDMGIDKLVPKDTTVRVNLRVVLTKASLKLRCFDGYDWPELLGSYSRSIPRECSFLIDEANSHELEKNRPKGDSPSRSKSKSSQLLEGLLSSKDTLSSTTFQSAPLPEEKSRLLAEQHATRHWSRQTGRFIQVSADGISLRMDVLEPSTDHRLASCLQLKGNDFFVAETISNRRPLKMAGEWVNASDHPRDTNDGLFAMKMITWHAAKRVTDSGEIANDECELVLKLLPLRCKLDQRSIRFAKLYFAPSEGNDHTDVPEGSHVVPPPKFLSFRVLPFKLKVDYQPEKMDTQALRDGALVELVNLSPIEGMILTLQKVEISDEIGLGSVVGILTKAWVQDVCSTQLVKFLTNSSPLEPITHVGGGIVDLVVLPWEAVSNGDSLRRALGAGVSSFAKAVVYETLTLSSRVAGFVAQQVSQATTTEQNLLPSRPIRVPRTVTDASSHAVESVSRGLQTASYKIVIVPYREYRRTGASGVARSVLKGIPIAMAAPTSGMAEALSFTLLGARNQIRPDVRIEEEANQRGLHHEE